jgi:hypothetical protein
MLSQMKQIFEFFYPPIPDTVCENSVFASNVSDSQETETLLMSLPSHVQTLSLRRVHISHTTTTRLGALMNRLPEIQHLVFEPSTIVAASDLARGLQHLLKLKTLRIQHIHLDETLNVVNTLHSLPHLEEMWLLFYANTHADIRRFEEMMTKRRMFQKTAESGKWIRRVPSGDAVPLTSCGPPRSQCSEISPI